MNISEDKTNIGGKIYEGSAAQEARREGRKAFRKMNEGRVRPARPTCVGRPSQVAILAMQSQSQG